MIPGRTLYAARARTCIRYIESLAHVEFVNKSVLNRWVEVEKFCLGDLHSDSSSNGTYFSMLRRLARQNPARLKGTLITQALKATVGYVAHSTQELDENVSFGVGYIQVEDSESNSVLMTQEMVRFCAPPPTDVFCMAAFSSLCGVPAAHGSQSVVGVLQDEAGVPVGRL